MITTGDRTHVGRVKKESISETLSDRSTKNVSLSSLSVPGTTDISEFLKLGIQSIYLGVHHAHPTANSATIRTRGVIPALLLLLTSFPIQMAMTSATARQVVLTVSRLNVINVVQHSPNT